MVSGVREGSENPYFAGSGTYGHAESVSERRPKRSETGRSEGHIYSAPLEEISVIQGAQVERNWLFVNKMSEFEGFLDDKNLFLYDEGCHKIRKYKYIWRSL